MTGQPLRMAPDATDLRARPVIRPVPFADTERPDRIPEPFRLRAMNAAVRARKAYPGPAGEVLEADLRSYADMGWLARANHPLHQLIAQLMDDPLGADPGCPDEG